MKKTIQLYIALFITLFGTSTKLFSQNNQESILLKIEESLKGHLAWNNDSTWLNLQLNLKKSASQIDSTIQYRLIKTGKENFHEGPHQKMFDSLNPTIQRTQFGDSLIIIRGYKMYTYIGNSSWGYYYTYHLLRSDLNLKEPKPLKIDTNLQIKIRDINTCEHGWDMLRGQPCVQCMHSYKMQYDSSYRVNDSLKKLKFQTQILDCAHGHICCETSFCKCCPEHLRKKSIITRNNVKAIGNPVCKHGYNQNLGKACPQCLLEYRMSKDSSLNPYTDYIPLIDSSSIKTVPLDCAHGHICCLVKCPCCPKGGYIPPVSTPPKRKWWQRKRKK